MQLLLFIFVLDIIRMYDTLYIDYIYRGFFQK